MKRWAFAAVGTLSTLVLACSSQPSQSSTESGKALIEAYVSAWNRHDPAALDTLMAPDAVHEDIASNFHGQGPAEVKEFMQFMIDSEPDFEWRLTKVIESGPIVAAEWTWTGTYSGDSPSGPVRDMRVSGRGATIAEIEDGRIKRFTDYYDYASFFRKAPADSASQ